MVPLFLPGNLVAIIAGIITVCTLLALTYTCSFNGLRTTLLVVDFFLQTPFKKKKENFNRKKTYKTIGRSEFVDLSPFDEPLVSVICLSGLYLQLLAVILAYLWTKAPSSPSSRGLYRYLP